MRTAIWHSYQDTPTRIINESRKIVSTYNLKLFLYYIWIPTDASFFYLWNQIFKWQNKIETYIHYNVGRLCGNCGDMLASIAVAIAVLSLQDTSLKPLFAWPSEYSASAIDEIANDEENSIASLRIVQPADAIACHNNTDDYFNRRYFHLTDRISYGISINSQTACASSGDRRQLLLREYKKEDVVRCLDSLSIKKKRRPIHIAFIGDSTVRQHFVSFIRVSFLRFSSFLSFSQ